MVGGVQVDEFGDDLQLTWSRTGKTRCFYYKKAALSFAAAGIDDAINEIRQPDCYVT
jgi:hypothetical protein